MNELILIGTIAVVGLMIWALARKGRMSREFDNSPRDDALRKADRHLRNINDSLGFAEGTGPTGVKVDDEYRIVDPGRDERMKNDPAYAFADRMAKITMDMLDLENVLKEAETRSDYELAGKIKKELEALELKAHSMIDQYQG